MNLLTFEEWGRYFGYPECCIKWFVEHAGTKLTTSQNAVHGHRGFIPCPSCADKVTRETLHTLLVDRKCALPFPHDGF